MLYALLLALGAAAAAGVLLYGRLRRYRLVAESAGDLVAMVDRDGRWLYASAPYERMLGRGEVAPGRDAFACVEQEDQFRVRGAVQVVVRSGESCRLRLRLHTRKGALRRFEMFVHPVFDGAATGGGKGGAEDIRGAVLVSRDITGLRDREEHLEVAMQAIERMSEGMMISSAGGRIVSINPSFTRITGYTPAEVLGRQESEFRSAMQPQSFYDDLYAEVLRSGYWTGICWSQRRDGTAYREWRSVSAVRDPEGRVAHFLALIRELDEHGNGADVSERPRKSA